MYVFELQYKVRSQADADEGIRLFKELAVPVFRCIPGLMSVDIYKYSKAGGNPPEWDYVYVEVWESKEAHANAMGRYIGVGTDSELARTGYYDKIMPMIEKSAMAFATPVVSSK
jgi:cobalamin biosynthesis Mg chelatase CobN